jgi:hypothetical protein
MMVPNPNLQRGKDIDAYLDCNPSLRSKVTTAISETPAIVEYEVAKDED